MKALLVPSLLTSLLLVGCGSQPDENADAPIAKFVVAMEPDKDPDAMLADRLALQDLKGKPIAFSSRTSTSGFLIPTWDLYTQGLIDLETGPEGFFGPGNVFYGVGYVSAAERVLDGSAEAAAVSYYVLDQDKHLGADQRAQLKVIDTQGPVPSHVIVVRTALSSEDREALRASLLGMNEAAPELRDRIFGATLAPAEADTHLRITREALELMRTMKL